MNKESLSLSLSPQPRNALTLCVYQLSCPWACSHVSLAATRAFSTMFDLKKDWARSLSLSLCISVYLPVYLSFSVSVSLSLSGSGPDMAHGHASCTRGLQEAAWMWQHSNGLQLETHATWGGCWTGLDFNLQQKLWTLAVVLVLPKIRLDLVYGRRGRDGTLGSQEGLP